MFNILNYVRKGLNIRKGFFRKQNISSFCLVIKTWCSAILVHGLLLHCYMFLMFQSHVYVGNLVTITLWAPITSTSKRVSVGPFSICDLYCDAKYWIAQSYEFREVMKPSEIQGYLYVCICRYVNSSQRKIPSKAQEGEKAFLFVHFPLSFWLSVSLQLFRDYLYTLF